MIDDLKVAISEKDTLKARRIMINELIGSNYPHEVFKDAIELATEYNIFEEHNKEKLLSNPKAWDLDYLELLKSKLINNFSEERFMTTYYVARKIEKDNKYKDLEKNYSEKSQEKYKDLILAAQIGAAVAGAAAVGIGVWLYNRNKDK